MCALPRPVRLRSVRSSACRPGPLQGKSVSMQPGPDGCVGMSAGTTTALVRISWCALSGTPYIQSGRKHAESNVDSTCTYRRPDGPKYLRW